MKAEGIKKAVPLSLIMLAALIMNGGFFDYSVAFTGALITVYLFIMLIKGEAFYKRDKRIIFVAPILIMCFGVAVSFWAIDYMDNCMGVMRLGVICLWMWLIRCRNREENSFVKNSLPVMGCIIVVVSAASFCLPNVKPYFWENGRMSGFFQYANTNGLFMAVCIMLFIQTWNKQKKIVIQLVQLFLLLMGLLLTGSRSILLLLMLWGIWYALTTPEFRKPFLAGILLLVLLSGAFVIITGNTSNIGRIYTIFKSNSTFWGRLLYDWDAILLLKEKFYGLGRMGYYYSQGTFQSGVYHIRFAHNDFLQIALDYGVITLLLLLIFIGWQVVKGKQSRRDKEILLFVCVASFVDFHCQYLFILMLACLFLDYGECNKEKKKELRENYIVLPMLFAVFLYIGIATGCSKLGKQDIALSMLPDFTYAQEKKIVSCMGTQDSYEIATRLIQKNPYNITAYIIRGSFYASQLCVEQCIEDLDKMLELDPYNVNYYREYEALLRNLKSQIELYSKASGNKELEQQYEILLQERIESLPGQLANMRDRTSALAYKIKDEPIFTY